MGSWLFPLFPAALVLLVSSVAFGAHTLTEIYEEANDIVGSSESIGLFCPLGDNRQGCILEPASFHEDIRVTFRAQGDEIPTESQAELLGMTLGRLYNDYASRIKDPRVVCSVVLKKYAPGDSSPVFSFSVLHDDAFTRGLAQVFGAPIDFTPTQHVTSRLLKEKKQECWISGDEAPMPVFPNHFLKFVNKQLPTLKEEVHAFESIAAITKYHSGRALSDTSNRVWNKRAVDVGGDQPMGRKLSAKSIECCPTFAETAAESESDIPFAKSREGAGNNTEGLDATNSVVEAGNTRSSDLGLVAVSPEIVSDGTCNRDEVVEEVVVVDALLEDCDNGRRVADLEDNFCDIIKSSFSKLSAQSCDPSYRMIDECEPIAFEGTDEEIDLPGLGRKKRRKRGRYSVNVRTRGRSTRYVRECCFFYL